MPKSGVIMKKTMPLLLAAALLCSACTAADAGGDVSLRKHAPADLDARIVQADNAFGLKLHRTIAEQNPGSNVFVSPFSVSMALSMVYHGAGGATREQIGQTLQSQGLSVDEWNRGHQALRDLLEHSGKETQLSVANSIWARKGVAFHESFLQRNRDFYGAEVDTLDFAQDNAVRKINQWVGKRTNGKIDSIVQGPISSETVMYLLNAVYFKAQWQHPFPERDTKPGTFHVAAGQTKPVNLMALTGRLDYAQEPDYQAIRLPYADGKLAMVVVLPSEKAGLEKVQQKLWADEAFWNKPFSSASGTLKLPRLKLELGYELNDALKAMGMSAAFDPAKADFSGLSPKPVLISEVKHKTFVEMNEQGTEAAAVSSVGVQVTSAPAPVAKPFEMIVDRPFLMAIQSTETGSLLFLGSIVDPKE
ncbi:serpin family protein [Paenibacillus tyrfis]|uniref:serpin family protein n=1 Tax=Paenibacillus tyrfis TaxID=1501230 RepID=UPI000B58904B|nr:serpin family protein [Paenibacillus tyrfis]